MNKFKTQISKKNAALAVAGLQRALTEHVKSTARTVDNGLGLCSLIGRNFTLRDGEGGIDFQQPLKKKVLDDIRRACGESVVSWTDYSKKLGKPWTKTGVARRTAMIKRAIKVYSRVAR